MRLTLRVVVLAVVSCAAVPPLVRAQTPQQTAQQAADQRLREQRDELERVRRERESLEHEASVLNSTAHELSDQVTNLDKRVEASARIVASLEKQLQLIVDAVAVASSNMSSAERELGAKRLTLRNRVVDVYKRGPMFTVEAMLSAHSFGELVARYKYLHDLTLRDRSLVTRVEQLRNEIVRERDRLVTLQGQLEINRDDKAHEENRLRELESQQASNLRSVRRQAQQTDDKLARLKKTETDLVNILAAMEAAKKRNDASKPIAARASSSIKTGDYGKLDWPVDGSLIYSFGKAQTASNATIHWNGVGIRAAAGTPVHTIGAGKVAMVAPLGTYGLTVIIDHGAGDYTIYGSLQKAAVKNGQAVAKGDIIGETGVSDPDLPAHLHFEIRNGRDAIDPVTWLRAHR